jgi:hypothetical protein
MVTRSRGKLGWAQQIKICFSLCAGSDDSHAGSDEWLSGMGCMDVREVHHASGVARSAHPDINDGLRAQLLVIVFAAQMPVSTKEGRMW